MEAGGGGGGGRGAGSEVGAGGWGAGVKVGGSLSSVFHTDLNTANVDGTVDPSEGEPEVKTPR